MTAAIENPKTANILGTDSDIKERLLDVAEQLFAEHGIAETGVRTITTATGVNVASVNYYFGSKDGLVNEVIHRRLGPLNWEAERLLENCNAFSGEAIFIVNTALVALVGPHIRLCFEHPYFALLISRLRMDSDKTLWQNFRSQRKKVIDPFRAVLASTLPELSSEELDTRLHYVLGALGHLGNHCPMPPDKNPDAMLRSFLAFYGPALCAPAPDLSEFEKGTL